MPPATALPLDYERADAFLARVAKLTPLEWGLLDAVDARLRGSDLLTRWTRARRVGAATSFEPWIGAITTPAAFVGEALFDTGFAVWRAYRSIEGLRDPEASRRHFDETAKWYQRMTQQTTARSAAAPGIDLQRARAQFDDLVRIAREQPGSILGNVPSCLFAGWYAILMRPNLMPDAFRELYGPVEAIIPASSLDPSSDRSSSASSAKA